MRLRDLIQPSNLLDRLKQLETALLDETFPWPQDDDDDFIKSLGVVLPAERPAGVDTLEDFHDYLFGLYIAQNGDWNDDSRRV